jgi:hypothetical protein
MVMSNAANVTRFTDTAHRLLARLETLATAHLDRRRAESMRAEGEATHYFDRLGELKLALDLAEDPVACETMARVKFAYFTACGPRRPHYAADLAKWDADIEADAARGAIIAASLGL